jgi:hypothetical protein
MDLETFWQENKRFLGLVAAGLVLFLLGELAIGAAFGDDLAAQRRALSTATRNLSGESFYGRQELERARADNEALKGALDQLARAVAFETRAPFRLDPARGSASSQYFAAASRTRDELVALAGRADLRLPETVGLPALSPTRDEEIERHLEALDLIDRVVRLCVDAGVERIDTIDITLDPALSSRQGVGFLERTRIAFKLSGDPTALQRLLLATQAEGEGTPLLLGAVELQLPRRENESARLDASFVVGRLHGVGTALEGEEEP